MSNIGRSKDEKRDRPQNKQIDSRTVVRQISYEMHWARQRVPAKVEYAELEPQPADKSPYTENDIQTRMDKTTSDQDQTEERIGKKHQRVAGKTKSKIQAK